MKDFDGQVVENICNYKSLEIFKSGYESLCQKYQPNCFSYSTHQCDYNVKTAERLLTNV